MIQNTVRQEWEGKTLRLFPTEDRAVDEIASWSKAAGVAVSAEM
jgi:hypothetical protein